MENASKALIIAGAILLAILLISLGILIFNQAQDTVNNSGMSQAEITAFNNKFLKYEGTQKGSVVKSMVNDVISSNASDENKNNNRGIRVYLDKVCIIGKDAGDGQNKASSKIETSKTYTVEVGYKDGIVEFIDIYEK